MDPPDRGQWLWQRLANLPCEVKDKMILASGQSGKDVHRPALANSDTPWGFSHMPSIEQLLDEATQHRSQRHQGGSRDVSQLLNPFTDLPGPPASSSDIPRPPTDLPKSSSRLPGPPERSSEPAGPPSQFADSAGPPGWPAGSPPSASQVVRNTGPVGERTSEPGGMDASTHTAGVVPSIPAGYGPASQDGGPERTDRDVVAGKRGSNIQERGTSKERHGQGEEVGEGHLSGSDRAVGERGTSLDDEVTALVAGIREATEKTRGGSWENVGGRMEGGEERGVRSIGDTSTSGGHSSRIPAQRGNSERNISRREDESRGGQGGERLGRSKSREDVNRGTELNVGSRDNGPRSWSEGGNGGGTTSSIEETMAWGSLSRQFEGEEPTAGSHELRYRFDDSRAFHSPYCEIAMAEAFQAGAALDGLSGSLMTPAPGPEAVEQLRESIRQQINTAWAQEALKRGVQLAKEGDTSEARHCYSRALDLDPSCANAHVAMGAAYANEGSFQEAAKHFQLALGIDSNCSNAQKYLDAVRQKMEASLRERGGTTSEEEEPAAGATVWTKGGNSGAAGTTTTVGPFTSADVEKAMKLLKKDKGKRKHKTKTKHKSKRSKKRRGS